MWLHIRYEGASEGAEEKLKLFKSEKFMTWRIRSSAELILHWYSIEENISSPVLTKERSEL